MKRTSVTEAKNRLSALLDHVRQGGTVIIEDRGVPVAQLNPVVTPAAADQDRLARLIRQGILRPPASSTRDTDRDETTPPKPRQRVSLSHLLIEERRESR